ncbi:MAG: prepilin-type N-terminal cleavage/methylation domain-containing protein [Gemmatimonadota bacterium]|nr:prepilin-type N-terminal cleavage/methylation domain-containing protein [Gemmatimonadota bacterium]
MRKRNGFTIIEVLVAVLVLAVGILGMATTAALVTRMIGQGQRFSEVSAVAAQRFEMLRSRPCATMANGSATQGPYVLSWTVDSVAAGKARSLRLIVISPTTRTTRADTFATTVPCWE